MDLSTYLRERALSKVWLYIATIAFFVAVTPILAVYYELVTVSGSQTAIFVVASLVGFVVTAVSLRQYWQHTRRESAEL